MPISSDNKIYSVIPQADGSFAVEIFGHDGAPELIPDFATQLEADEWVTRAMQTGDAASASGIVAGQTARM